MNLQPVSVSTRPAGVCAWLYDPDQRHPITVAVARDLVALGVTDVRVVIKADAKNVLDLDAYVGPLAIYKAAGLRVLALLDCDFNRPWLEGDPNRLIYPNQALGYDGNRRQNRWIADCVKRAETTARKLRLYVDAWASYNEPNLLALLGTGKNVPPVVGQKAPALAPRVWISHGVEVADALRAGGAATVYLGSLSWIAGSGSIQSNPYCAAYLRTALEYLGTTGIDLTVQRVFDGLVLNCEGWWTEAAARAMAGAILEACAPWDLRYPLYIGEWGTENVQLQAHPERAEPTYRALCAIAAGLYFFQYAPSDLGNLARFGLRALTTGPKGYLPFGDPLPWYPTLKELNARTV